MWMNSPLGKWDQDARVNKALLDAERLRVEDEADDADVAARRGGPLQAASVGLHWLAARTRGAVESTQTWLASPSVPHD